MHETMLSPHEHYHTMFPGQAWVWTVVASFQDMDEERLKDKGMFLLNTETNTQAWNAASQQVHLRPPDRNIKEKQGASSSNRCPEPTAEDQESHS